MYLQNYMNALIADCKVWPIAQLFNFYFVPLQYRVGFSGVVSIGWNCYLSCLQENKIINVS